MGDRLKDFITMVAAAYILEEEYNTSSDDLINAEEEALFISMAQDLTGGDEKVIIRKLTEMVREYKAKVLDYPPTPNTEEVN